MVWEVSYLAWDCEGVVRFDIYLFLLSLGRLNEPARVKYIHHACETC